MNERDADGGGALDAQRARIIDSLYEVLLRPAHFPVFVTEWTAFIERAAQGLGAFQISEGAARETLDDPVLTGHFRRASALFERLGRGEAAEPLVNGAPSPVARILNGEVVACAPELMRPDGTRPDIEDLCESLTADSATRLRVFLRKFEQAPASGHFVVLSRVASSHDQAAGLWSAVSVHDNALEGFAIEIRALEIGWTPRLGSVLADSFGLTPRETELVRALVEGSDLAAISAREGRSMNTLRAQLRSIFAKTRAHSQAELLRLVAVLMVHGVAAAAPAPLTEDRVSAVALPGGRQMLLREAGPAHGTPVVFVHGMLEGLGSFHRLAPHLHGARLRLIAPTRSNFGRGSVDPRTREAPQIFARDLEAALDAIGLERVVLCGHFAGAIPAYAAAQHLGPRCAGVVNVSGNVPSLSLDQFATISKLPRAVAYTARFAPDLLPTIFHAAIAHIDSRNAEDFARSLYQPGSPDRALLDDPSILASLVSGIRYAVAQGIRGFQIDSWHVTRNWSRLTEGLDCPVLLIHGSEDRVVTLKSVQDFARNRSNVTLEPIKGAGQLLLYGRSMGMADRIGRFAREALADRGGAA